MKILRWKYIAAACSTCLLLFTTPAPAPLIQIPLGRELLKFDDLDYGSSVLSGYGGLVWENFYVIDPTTVESPDGFLAGLISPNNVIGNTFYYSYPTVGKGANQEPFLPQDGVGSSVISSYFGHLFILNSAYLTAAGNDNLLVTVEGYYLNKLVYSRTYKLSAVKPTSIKFPTQPVTRVFFTPSGGTPHKGYHAPGDVFVMDNLTVTILAAQVAD